VSAGSLARLIKPAFQGFEQNLSDKGALAGAGYTRDACKDAERKLDIDIL